MKPLFSVIVLILIIFLTSCQKEYTCVCKSSSKGDLHFYEKVKTTNLGKKGLKKTCESHQESNPDLTDCHLE